MIFYEKEHGITENPPNGIGSGLAVPFCRFRICRKKLKIVFVFVWLVNIIAVSRSKHLRRPGTDEKVSQRRL
jgi:hypothetical protein